MDKWDKVASKLRETEQNHNLILSRIDGNKSVDSVIALNLAPPIPLEDENAPDVKDEYQQAVSGILEKSLFDFVADDFYWMKEDALFAINYLWIKNKIQPPPQTGQQDTLFCNMNENKNI